MHKINGNFKGKSIVSIEQFTLEDIAILFNEVDVVTSRLGRGDVLGDLRGRVVANLFYEASTRTSSSFSAATQYLGGGVVAINDVHYSSVSKGENLADTVRTLAQYADAIVLRHPEKGAAMLATRFCTSKPIINAGDGVGEHPTQALLDLYTIIKKFKTLKDLRVAMVGDLKHGRTVHSLAYLLARYGVRFTFVAPKGFEMPPSVKKYLQTKGCTYKEYATLKVCIQEQDVVYVTRVQEERIKQRVSVAGMQQDYRVTPTLMNQLPAEAILMHPLPRVGEIDPAVDDDPRAVYFAQVQNGLHLRMALLRLVLAR